MIKVYIKALPPFRLKARQPGHPNFTEDLLYISNLDSFNDELFDIINRCDQTEFQQDTDSKGFFYELRCWLVAHVIKGPNVAANHTFKFKNKTEINVVVEPCKKPIGITLDETQAFLDHLKQCSVVVSLWSEWKQNVGEQLLRREDYFNERGETVTNENQAHITIRLKDSIVLRTQAYPDWVHQIRITTARTAKPVEVHVSDLLAELSTLEFSNDRTISSDRINSHRRAIKGFMAKMQSSALTPFFADIYELDEPLIHIRLHIEHKRRVTIT